MDGHTVVYATNGQECVDIIRSDHEFDCILMDIQYVNPLHMSVTGLTKGSQDALAQRLRSH